MLNKCTFWGIIKASTELLKKLLIDKVKSLKGSACKIFIATERKSWTKADECVPNGNCTGIV